MPNSRERLYLFDTTLRDGQQTTGIDFSLDDKITIARMLDELGVDYVEGGYPGANPTDSAFFEEKRTAKRHLHRLRHDAARGRFNVQRSRPESADRCGGRCHLLCRQELGLPCARRAEDDQ
jgi:isopropylmalate/homocitrate/citramalate synthase